MTILAIIVTIVFSALRVGVRAWEKGGSDIEARQRHRTVLQLLSVQLASAYVDLAGYRRWAVFRGDTEHLDLVTHLSLVPESTQHLIYARYRVKTDAGGRKDLLFHETDAGDLFRPLPTEEPSDEAYYPLLTGFHDIRFEYVETAAGLAGEGDPVAAWRTEWRPQGDDRPLPAAVRIIVRETPDAIPVMAVAPIRRTDP